MPDDSIPTALIALTWISFVLNLVMAAWLAMGLRRVYRVKNQVQWEARHFGPLSFSVFLTIFFVAVERNLQLFGSASDYFKMGTQWRWLLNNAFTFSFLSVYALRAWIVHFDYHTGLAMLAQLSDWENFTVITRERVEWFLLNRTLYGSPRYLTQFFIIMVIVLTLSIWGWIVVSPETYYYGIVAIYAGLMLVIMTVTQKITVINDYLFIRHELLCEFRVLAAFFVLLGFLIIFGSPMGWHYCIFFVVEASAIAMTAMAGTATWWMLDKSVLFNFPLLKEKRLKALGQEEEKENEGKRAPPLRTVINDQEASVFFFRHLVRELSLENVFFLADIMRYKNSFVQPKVLDSVPGFSIQIRDMAKHSNVSGRTLVQYALALSQAYVENISASYVTAIHEETRDRIFDYLAKVETKQDDEFDAREWTELCNVFDRAAEEVWILVNQAWQRYTKSPYFSEFKMSAGNDRARTLSSEAMEALRRKQQIARQCRRGVSIFVVYLIQSFFFVFCFVFFFF